MEYIEQTFYILSSLTKYSLMLILIFGFDFIFNICAMIVIAKDANKRGVSCWHWNLLTFFFGFIPVLLYMIIICSDKNQNKNSNQVIDMRTNNSENVVVNPITEKIKTPKYFIFYIIIEIIFIISSIILIQNIVHKSFELLKNDYVTTIISEEISSSYNEQSTEITNQIENNSSKSPITFNFNFQNIDEFDDIEDYAKIIFNNSIEKIQNAISITENNSIKISNTKIPTTIVDDLNKSIISNSDEMLNTSVNNLIQHFIDNLSTVKFDYKFENNGILKIIPINYNLSKHQKNETFGPFFGDDLNCVVIISQFIDGNVIYDTIDFDFEDYEVEYLENTKFKKGYPLYISFYSDVPSNDYGITVNLK